jgi:hypothetical protein
MLSPSLSFRRPAFSRVAAPVFAVIFAFAGSVAAQPTPRSPAAPPPERDALDVVTQGGPATLRLPAALLPERDALDVVAQAPTAPMIPAAAPPPAAPPPAPILAPAPPPVWAPQPSPWGAQPPPWGAQPAPGAWPAYTPATPPSASFYRSEEPFSLPPAAPKEPANRKLMIAGVVASIGGVATLITGSILMSVAKERIDVYRDGPAYCCSIDDAPLRNAGITMLVIGGITATIGVPLWMIGGRRVPVRKTTTEAPGGAPPRAPASVAPLLRVGARGASLSWQF